MDSFVAVHVETPYVKSKRDRRVARLIGAEINETLKRGAQAHFLACTPHGPDSPTIPRPIRQHFPRLVYHADGPLELQILLLKERLLAAGTEHVAIAGYAYGYCVHHVHNALDGRPGFGLPLERYAHVAERLGWSATRFDEVFGARIPSLVRRELTDAPNPQ